jgi:hypothetical protein
MFGLSFGAAFSKPDGKIVTVAMVAAVCRNSRRVD